MTIEDELLPGDTPADHPAGASAPVAMTAVALLSPDGVYQGIGPIVRADELASGEVAIPVDCDLVPGRYKWDVARKTFVAVAAPNPVSDTPAPDALVAIALGFVATRAGGATLPDATLRWLDAFLTSIDIRDTAAVNTPDVAAYLRDRGLIKG